MTDLRIHHIPKGGRLLDHLSQREVYRAHVIIHGTVVVKARAGTGYTLGATVTA